MLSIPTSQFMAQNLVIIMCVEMVVQYMWIPLLVEFKWFTLYSMRTELGVVEQYMCLIMMEIFSTEQIIKVVQYTFKFILMKVFLK